MLSLYWYSFFLFLLCQEDYWEGHGVTWIWFLIILSCFMFMSGRRGTLSSLCFSASLTSQRILGPVADGRTDRRTVRLSSDFCLPCTRSHLGLGAATDPETEKQSSGKGFHLAYGWRIKLRYWHFFLCRSSIPTDILAFLLARQSVEVGGWGLAYSLVTCWHCVIWKLNAKVAHPKNLFKMQFWKQS